MYYTHIIFCYKNIIQEKIKAINSKYANVALCVSMQKNDISQIIFSISHVLLLLKKKLIFQFVIFVAINLNNKHLLSQNYIYI